MEYLTRTFRKYSLRSWFYGLVAAFIAWPFIMYVVLKLLYGTSIAPDYQASWLEHLPVLFFMVGMLVIELALLAVSLQLLRRTVRVAYRVAFFLVALIALIFLYQGVLGLTTYIDLVA